MIQPENSEMKTLTEGIVCSIILLAIIIYASLSMGVVTFDEPKENITTTIVPTTAPTVITTPTPTPIPTEPVYEDDSVYMARTNGHPVREWAYWYRDNASGYKYLNTFVTVYGYRRMPFFHFHSWSWGTGAFFKQSPRPGMDYLFVFVNMYSTEGSARQWLFQENQFQVQIKGKYYYPDTEISKTNGIKELYEVWDYAHVDSVKPYGYTIVQEAGTGIITARSEEYLRAGRSNAQDGWILFQIPQETKIEDVQVVGHFANLGGTQWWRVV